MVKNFSISVLIFSFILSSLNVGLAAEVVEVGPVIVQPYNNQALNQQVLDIDRHNRDEEVAIKELIEKNNQLTQDTLKHQEDEGLSQVNQTMLSYRNALYVRDQQRILANSQWPNRYGDLVALTEDADAATVHRELMEKSGMLTQKYKMLSDLKDEMTELNDKLTNQRQEALENKQKTIDGFEKLTKQQQDKIQMLVTRLDEMDKRLLRMEDALAQKEQTIAQLKEKLSLVQNSIAAKDQMIKFQADKIALLQQQNKIATASSVGITAIAPIVVNPPSSKTQAPAAAVPVTSAPVVVNRYVQVQGKPAAVTQELDEVIKEKQDQVDLLKSELEDKITLVKQQQKQIAQLENKQPIAPGLTITNTKSDALIKAQAQELTDKQNLIARQQDQIGQLKEQSRQLASRLNAMKTQAEQLTATSRQFNAQSSQYTNLKDSLKALNRQIKQQQAELKAKDESIRWMNKVVGAAKNKGKYYQLLSQENQIALQQVQEKVTGMTAQLTEKQGQLDALAAQLLNKDSQLAQMKMDKDMAPRQSAVSQPAVPMDDRLKLAKELVGLQEQEASLLVEKGGLEEAQNAIFDKHFDLFENRMKTLIARHQIHDVDLLNRLEELRNELAQKSQQESTLQAELREKIAQEKNQTVLQAQIQDLNTQLQAKQSEMGSIMARLKQGQSSTLEADTLKQQLADEQVRAAALKEQLENKTAEAQKMTMLVSDYQKKAEFNNSHAQAVEAVSVKNYQAQMAKQIEDLSDRLRHKEDEVIAVKKKMYDLQEAVSANTQELQAKDLTISMVQQKMSDEKIKAYEQKISGLQAMSNNQMQEIKDLRTRLELSNQQLNGMPSSDEIDFLRDGLKKATAELNQKKAMLSQTRRNADEYDKQFTKQSKEFQSLKSQLDEARKQIEQKDEDLKYKDMALKRLKEMSTKNQEDLRHQILMLNRKFKSTTPVPAPHAHLLGMLHGNKVEELQAELDRVSQRNKELQGQVNELESMSKADLASAKLKQALDKIDEQGRVINALVQKLQDLGHNVDLSKYSN